MDKSIKIDIRYFKELNCNLRKHKGLNIFTFFSEMDKNLLKCKKYHYNLINYFSEVLISFFPPHKYALILDTNGMCAFPQPKEIYLPYFFLKHETIYKLDSNNYVSFVANNNNCLNDFLLNYSIKTDNSYMRIVEKFPDDNLDLQLRLKDIPGKYEDNYISKVHEYCCVISFSINPIFVLIISKNLIFESFENIINEKSLKYNFNIHKNKSRS